MNNRRGILAVAIALLILISANTSLAQSDSNGQSSDELILRTLRGEYQCSTLDNGDDCGGEEWIITYLADETRILRAFQHIPSLGVQNSTILRVDKTFRPIDAFTNLYSRNRFFGSGSFFVDGQTMQISGNAPSSDEPGQFVIFSEQIAVPDRFSLLLYPNAAYGWILAQYDNANGGVQQSPMCVFAATGQKTSCAMMEQPLEYLGSETLAVPAGEFDTEHYKVGNSGDSWITGPDKIVVQHQHTGRNTRFQLVDYAIE